jgi:hypothetical protein
MGGGLFVCLGLAVVWCGVVCKCLAGVALGVWLRRGIVLAGVYLGPPVVVWYHVGYHVGSVWFYIAAGGIVSGELRGDDNGVVRGKGLRVLSKTWTLDLDSGRFLLLIESKLA